MILSFNLWLFFLFSMMTRPACYGDQEIRADTLIQGQQLKDGQSLYSSDSAFRLDFHSTSSSRGRYLVISDNHNPDTYYTLGVVWVANRDNPVPDTSGSLVVDPNDGLLKILFNGGNMTISTLLLSNTSLTPPGGNTTATLLDNGNLVLRQLNLDGSINSTLWQSFDYPTDTLLPGMKLGNNLRTGHDWTITSWMSGMEPASGIFTFTLSVDPSGMVQMIMWSRGSSYWTTGFLHDGWFDQWSFLSCYNFSYISNKDERYITFSVNCSDVDRTGLTLTSGGDIIAATISKSECYENLPEGCDWSVQPECRTKHSFSFEREDGYFDGESYIYPDNSNLTLFECQSKCIANCSCVAFGSTTEDGNGCEIWGKLSSIAVNGPEGKKRTLYTLHRSLHRSASKTKWWIWFLIAIAAVLSFGILFCLNKRRKLNIKGQLKEIVKTMKQLLAAGSTSSTRFTPTEKMIFQFSLESMIKATNNFSDTNKLGEGGFGPVYKGKLSCGQEVAIKRLSKNSGQGLVEFNNEVQLIAKLQHTNLVKLLGSCTQGQEKILVYEYMPNKSLDHFLFGSSRQGIVKWMVRMRIIEGIAQGLLYLHKYSRLKVIHRDLKASNVLLDHNMHPKISDFGMARLFEAQESEANTKRIAGTHGYMSPEYIINGVISLKTDVFSFGVLLLEIISGKRNRDSYDANRPLNLIGLAWELRIEERAMELADSSMDNHLDHKSELMKCINVGLLCVQDNPTDRPSMMEVVSMLTNKNVELPTPKQPAFYIESVREIDDKVASLKRRSTSDMSI